MTSKITVLTFITLIGSINLTNAQNLPNVQKASVKAPNGVKIDGKTSEWNDKFSAKNKSTGTFYTLANDKTCLYLVIQSTDALITKKIVGGGITLTINSTAKRDDPLKRKIIYPKGNAAAVNEISRWLNEMKSDTSPAATDSLLVLMNRELTARNKEINIASLKNMADSVLSVYNDAGIKTAMRINAKGALTYELSIPLYYLGFSATQGAVFMYNIQIGSATSTFRQHKVTTPEGRSFIITNMPMSLMSSSSESMAMSYPTDFWGTYALVVVH